MKKGLLLLMVFVCSVAANSQSDRRNRAAATSHATVANAVSSLPIRRVILYSNGVAYIERRGTVTGNAEINLSFKQSQVDDVLKSMVVLDLGQGKIGAVSYNSSAPASARMAEIPFSVNPLTPEGSGIAGVLSQLQGAKVSVSSGKGVVVGSVLTIEQKTIGGEKTPSSTSVLVIVSENGEISSFDLSEIRSVKLLDEGTRKDLNEFASAVASARRLDAKTITVTSEGTGRREMLVSYTIAAPIWKTTYRVVLDDAGKPFFQGWAIVDNVSEEDWNGVQMSLVSGSPISFIQNLQKPFYRYRPVVPTPEDLQLRPQVYEAQSSWRSGSSISGTVTDQNGAAVPGASVTITNVKSGASYNVLTDSDGSFSRDGFITGNYSVTVDSTGFKRTVVNNVFAGQDIDITLEVGSINAVVTVQGDASVKVETSASMLSNTMIDSSKRTSVSEALSTNNSGIETAAVGAEVGDLFEYRIERPITVSRNRSALIPIIQTKMEGERVAIYNESVRADRPMSGVFLKNTSDLTFESGSLTVLDGNAYAGEALMERLKPMEERLISFALDLGTHIRVRRGGDREPARLIKASKGVFQVHYFQSEERVYHISNQVDRPKTVYIEYPVRDGWELSERSPKPDYVTQRYYRFRLELKGFEEKELTISLRKPLMDTYQLAGLQRSDLELFVSRRYIDAETKTKLDKLIDLRVSIAGLENRLESFEEETEKIEADQKRLRENIESLTKTPEAKDLIARYIAKAGEQETRLEEMEKERKMILADKQRLEVELAVAVRTFEIR
ncbi:MAG: carboxypeptidase regulatory-like domain-containing protein [Pyrinomonadaceae bacterium]